jgi:hypothetical protein
LDRARGAASLQVNCIPRLNEAAEAVWPEAAGGVKGWESICGGGLVLAESFSGWGVPGSCRECCGRSRGSATGVVGWRWRCPRTSGAGGNQDFGGQKCVADRDRRLARGLVLSGVDVGMKDQGAAPGVEHAQHPELGAEPAGIGRQVLQGV